MTSDVQIFTQQKGVATAGNRPLTALGQQVVKNSTYTSRVLKHEKGKFIKLVNGNEVGEAVAKEIDVIIVNMLPEISRQYYDTAFSKKKQSEKYVPPTCFSNRGLVPDEGIPQPQAESCALCPQNVAGSGATGKSRACAFRRRVALVLAGDPSGEIYQMQFSATSLFGESVSANTHRFEKYIEFITTNGMSPDTVVTTISTNDSESHDCVLFSPAREVSDEEYESIVLRAQATPDADRYVKLQYRAPNDEAEAQQVVVKEPVAIEEPVEEPVKRPSKKQEEAPVEEDADLASIIGEWGDDD